MPEKEGAEEKSTKSVVNKKQKQMMGEEGYDVARDEGRVKPSKDKKDATTMPPSKEMEKLRKVNKGPSALERVKADIEKRYGKDAIMKVKKESTELLEMGKKFGPGGDPIKKKGFIDKSLNKLKVNTPVKKIDTDTDVKTEEAKSLFSTPGLDKLKKLKDFKSNADRVFGRKSPDLTKVAEAFGGYIVESEIDPKTGRISATPDEIKKERKILKKYLKNKNKNINQDLNQRRTAQDRQQQLYNRQYDAYDDGDLGNPDQTKSPTKTQPKSKVTTTGGKTTAKNPIKKTFGPKITTSKTPIFDVDKKGQGRFDLGDTTTSGDPISTKKKRALGTSKKSGGRQLRIRGLIKQGRRSPKLTTKGLERVRKKVATSAAKETSEKALRSAALKKVERSIAKGAAKTVVKKAAAKGAAKFAAKRIPGIGAAISGAEAIGRAASGDFVGAALAAGEGILSSIPGAGTVASAGLGAVSATRDARRALKVGSKLKKTARSVYKTARKAKTSKGKAFKTPDTITKAFKGNPKKFGVDTTPSGKKVKDYLFKDLPGTGKNRTKDLILGKTRFGRGLRVGATADRIKKFVGGVPKPKTPDGSHVGRRTAG